MWKWQWINYSVLKINLLLILVRCYEFLRLSYFRENEQNKINDFMWSKWHDTELKKNVKKLCNWEIISNLVVFVLQFKPTLISSSVYSKVLMTYNKSFHQVKHFLIKKLIC